MDQCDYKQGWVLQVWSSDVTTKQFILYKPVNGFVSENIQITGNLDAVWQLSTAMKFQRKMWFWGYSRHFSLYLQLQHYIIICVSVTCAKIILMNCRINIVAVHLLRRRPPPSPLYHTPLLPSAKLSQQLSVCGNIQQLWNARTIKFSDTPQAYMPACLLDCLPARVQVIVWVGVLCIKCNKKRIKKRNKIIISHIWFILLW